MQIVDIGVQQHVLSGSQECRRRIQHVSTEAKNAKTGQAWSGLKTQVLKPDQVLSLEFFKMDEAVVNFLLDQPPIAASIGMLIEPKPNGDLLEGDPPRRCGWRTLQSISGARK